MTVLAYAVDGERAFERRVERLYAGNVLLVQAIQDMAASLAPLGTPSSFTQASRSERGGMTFRAYQVRFGQKTIVITVRIMPDGKFEQYQIAAS